MQLPQIGETWTGLYNKRYNNTFKVLDIVPMRAFMENVAEKLEKIYPEGVESQYASMLREKIASGDYDKYGNVYIIHYTNKEYLDGAYNILLESGIRAEWENLRPLT